MLGALVVVFGVTALATRESSAMAPAPGDRADVVLPEGAGADDVRAVRFGLALRGYRMRDVDDVLERLAAELAARDARIAVLEGREPAVPAGEDAQPADVEAGAVVRVEDAQPADDEAEAVARVEDAPVQDAAGTPAGSETVAPRT